ncbi:hypothetical protein P175DRAFT_0500040 [Aspergillus ochraceoroseus IBT 24754]|uniref:Uncharacterized protein n=1 Tax=Aspergillus ochraceoroseus IBT 24754 TaxID=1392256 RepID=A0A2T5M4M1_9EURO|nr:uncharacterized protein P175DRAFT_0500040 [Aspergillus ochraceoroseus IBT 24754]PTU23481.1 hypothetical protein P175DRAFT_0500040 [Aspergillus ochraceoroseus IBT 24754]
MPMKWTAENDQLLLLKILETHDLSVDTKRVAEAWPSLPGQDLPTPRAITERLVRMRQLVKSNNNAEARFSIAKGTGSSSAHSTPRKPHRAATASSTPGSGKRRRINDVNSTWQHSDSDSISPVKMELDVDGGPITPTKQPLRPTTAGMNQGQKHTEIGSGSSTIKLEKEDVTVVMGGNDVTPTKRSRRASTLPPGIVTYVVDEDAADDVESSASEYAPDESAPMDDYEEYA